MKNQNYTKKVNFRDPIDFQTLSVITGISEKELMNLNPGYSTWIIDPTQQNTLLLPNKEAKLLKKDMTRSQKLYMRIKYIKFKKAIVYTRYQEFIMSKLML
jgi:hypothetical protein